MLKQRWALSSVNEQQLAVIEFLKEENRVLRELHGKKGLRFTDDQRRRFAAKGKAVGRRALRKIGMLRTPCGGARSAATGSELATTVAYRTEVQYKSRR